MGRVESIVSFWIHTLSHYLVSPPYEDLRGFTPPILSLNYRVDKGLNAARKRARDTMAPLNNKTKLSTYP